MFLLARLAFGICTVQAPVDEPVAPGAPAPEVGVAPARVESTPAVQSPTGVAAQPAPAAAPQPVPEPALAPDPTAAPTYAPTTEPAPASVPSPGVGTSQQDPNQTSRVEHTGDPAYVPTDPQPGDKDGKKEAKQQKRDDRKDKRKRKPFLYNPLWLGVGLGMSFSGAGRGALNVGANATYFFIPWVGAGADVGNTFFFGAEDDEVSNIFTFTPTLTLLPFPRAKFSPYVRGGVGPVVYNKGVGTLGRWVGGVGFVSRFSRAFLNLGVDISGQFPDERYTDLIGGEDNCRISTDPCSLNITPRLGIGIALGSRRR